MAENIVLQAMELGIVSCIIFRGEETFDSEEGRALMKEWGVPDNYICQGFVILGYIDGEQPVSKPGKPGRVQIIDLYDFRQRKKMELHETSVLSI